jgi:hypothetical protein
MTTKADSKRRIVLPPARPGDVFEIQDHGGGRFTLIRLERPEPNVGFSRSQCLRAMDAAPLRPRMDWPALRKVTREP